MKKIPILLLLASVISACAVGPNGRVGLDSNVINKQSVLSLGGGLLGAAVCNKLFDGHGSRKGWTAACGAAGYFLSSSFLQKHNRAMEYNKIGEASSWSDPDGKQYSVTPTRTFAGPSDIPCRDFRQTVEINGQTEILQGTACRQNNGTWKLES